MSLNVIYQNNQISLALFKSNSLSASGNRARQAKCIPNRTSESLTISFKASSVILPFLSLIFL